MSSWSYLLLLKLFMMYFYWLKLEVVSIIEPYIKSEGSTFGNPCNRTLTLSYPFI